jgi:hypothetical protein
VGKYSFGNVLLQNDISIDVLPFEKKKKKEKKCQQSLEATFDTKARIVLTFRTNTTIATHDTFDGLHTLSFFFSHKNSNVLSINSDNASK